MLTHDDWLARIENLVAGIQVEFEAIARELFPDVNSRLLTPGQNSAVARVWLSRRKNSGETPQVSPSAADL